MSWTGKGLWLLVAGVALAAAVGGIAIHLYRRQPPHEASTPKDRGLEAATESPTVRQDRQAVIPRAAYREAARQFERAYNRPPDHHDTLSWLGESAYKAGNLPLAVACFRKIPSSHPKYGVPSRYQQGEALVKMRRARAAEESFLELLELKDVPQSYTTSAIFQLVYLYAVELRFEERHRLLARLHEMGEAQLEDTLNYCFPSLHRWNGSQAAKWLEEMWKQDSDDFRLRVALGRYRTGQGRLDEARRILEKCCSEKPTDLSAQAALLACLREQADWNAIEEVVANLPDTSSAQPWLLLRLKGHFFRRRGRYHEALACYEQLLEVLPTDAESNLGMAKVYAELEERKKREAALERAQALARIQNRLGWAGRTSDNAEPLLEIARICREHGWSKEAQLVVRTALKYHPDHEQLLKFAKK